MNHITDNHDALLDYLYEEGDPAERLTIARHLQECAACAVAVLEFQNVRGMLSDWAPPASRLGFRMVQDADASPAAPVTAARVKSLSAPESHGARSERSWGWGPATSQRKPTGPSFRALFQSAAAILLFVSGMAVSQLSVDYQNGVLTVRMPSAVPVMNAGKGWITLPPDRGIPATDEVVRRVLAALEGQNVSPVDAEGLLQRVRSMVDQSEQRQQRELALRLSQVSREVETQHQYDVQRMEQNFGRQQDATMDYLVKTSGGMK